MSPKEKKSKSKKSAPVADVPAPQLLASIGQFLKDAGFNSTFTIFNAEYESKKVERPEVYPSLKDLFDQWQSSKGNSKDQKANSKKKKEASKEDDKKESSDDSDSSSEADDERAAAPESDDSDSDSDSDSSDDGAKEVKDESSVTISGDEKKSSNSSESEKEYEPPIN